MDIGHLRHVRWVKDDDPKSQINKDPNLTQNGKTAAQNRWIAYNKMRGQYASAMEHAAPEAFWVDKMKCSHTDENGRIQNSTLNPCAEGISAVKAIAIAQAEGQKIYTINKQNAQTALQKLPIGGEVGSEIRNAVNAGKEVTVHEKSINKHGWKGFGYIVIDPETGAGAYIIEGKGNGGSLDYSNTELVILNFQFWGILEQILSLFAFGYPGLIGLLGSIIGSAVGVTIGSFGVAAQYENEKFCLTETQGASINQAITALGLLGQWGGLIPQTALTAIVVNVALLMLLFQIIHWIKINRAIGDC